ncbi:hypothetical protein PoB_003357200 [Plakobranchus ocellatus]|uniref:Uncharacterized protein n=1 Tax=Plakobranchus ocellatus TaxID=259542 RepID=A0AAV4AJ97_9GAST|nr:hypothetical protein PoB_003357200 [Plakobranchus ocellatus]
MRDRRRPKPAHEEREEDDAETLYAIAFAELVVYIESFRHNAETAPVFSMPNLCRLYGNRFKDQCLQLPYRVHPGRLKTANSVIHKVECHGVFVPISMMRKLFTVGGVDYNPNSKTVSDSFHGTDIYLILHRKVEEKQILSSRHLMSPGQDMHTVAAAALYVLLRQAFHKYSESNPQSKFIFDQRRPEMASSQPQFTYRALVLDSEPTAVQFVRSVRAGDFNLYAHCLLQLLPWFFALDHLSAGWLAVHVRYLTILKHHSPHIFNDFGQAASLQER